jgi:hypothetical protein
MLSRAAIPLLHPVAPFLSVGLTTLRHGTTEYYHVQNRLIQYSMQTGEITGQIILELE